MLKYHIAYPNFFSVNIADLVRNNLKVYKQILKWMSRIDSKYQYEYIHLLKTRVYLIIYRQNNYYNKNKSSSVTYTLIII